MCDRHVLVLIAIAVLWFSEGVICFAEDHISGIVDLSVMGSSRIKREDESNGLLTNIFANNNLEGDPIFNVVDSFIDKSSLEDFFPEQQHLDQLDSDHIFSVRWSGYITFPESGLYILSTPCNDGARLYLNDKLVIDEWTLGEHPNLESLPWHASQGDKYHIRVEYFNAHDNPAIRLLYRKIGDDNSLVTEGMLEPDTEVNGFVGHYYANPGLHGDESFSQTDIRLNFEEGYDAFPSDVANLDAFSVSWMGAIKVDDDGTYRFHVRVNDGVRLYIGKRMIMDHWCAVHTPTEYKSRKVKLSRGIRYIFKAIFFYQSPGTPIFHMTWSSDSFSKRLIPSENVFSEGGTTALEWVFGAAGPGYYRVEVANRKTGIVEEYFEGADEFILVDSSDGTDVGALSGVTSVDRCNFELGRFTIRVDGNIPDGGSVKFYVNGTLTRIDNEEPYFIKPNSHELLSEALSSWSILDGTYFVKAVPYTKPNGGGEMLRSINMTLHIFTSSPFQGVTGFSVVDALTGEMLHLLHNNTVINKTKHDESHFTIKAITHPEKVGSVKFYLNGTYYKTDETEPYILGEENASGLIPLPLPDGNYELMAKAYTESGASGIELPGNRVLFSVLSPPLYVVSLELIDVVTGNIIQSIDPENDVLDMSNVPSGRFSILAIIEPQEGIGSVQFTIDDVVTSQNEPPFAAGGYNDGYVELNLLSGSHELRVQVFEGIDQSGEVLAEVNSTLTFTNVASSFGIVTFSIIDIVTGDIVATLTDSSEEFDRADVTHGKWGIVANTHPEEVGSVRFFLNGDWGPYINADPYAGCGLEEASGDPQSCIWTLGEGEHYIEAQAFSKEDGDGVPLLSKSVTLTVFSSDHVDGVIDIFVVDVSNSSDVFALHNGTVIERSHFHLGQWNAKAVVHNEEEVGSVKFYIDGIYVATDDEIPYALCGEVSSGFKSCYLSDGFHKIEAIAYELPGGAGNRYKTFSVDILVTTSTQVEGVMKFILVDSWNNADVKDINDGDQVDRVVTEGGRWTIRAETKPAVVGSVKLYLGGQLFVTENNAPYSLCGHVDGNYTSCVFRVRDGVHTIKAVAYELADGKGRQLPGKTVTFDLITSVQVDGVTDILLVDANINLIDRELAFGEVVDRAAFELGEWNLVPSTFLPW